MYSAISNLAGEGNGFPVYDYVSVDRQCRRSPPKAGSMLGLADMSDVGRAGSGSVRGPKLQQCQISVPAKEFFSKLIHIGGRRMK